MKPVPVATLFRRLASTTTAPAHEFVLRDLVHALLKEGGVNFQTDPQGNTVARIRRGVPRNKLALVAHLDAPGFLVESAKGGALALRGYGLTAAPKKGTTLQLLRRGAVCGHATVGTTPKQDKAPGSPLRASANVKGDTATHEGDGLAAPAELQLTKGAASATFMSTVAPLVAIVGAMTELARTEHSVEVWALLTRGHHLGCAGEVALALSGLLPKDLQLVVVESIAATHDVKSGRGPVLAMSDAMLPFDSKTFSMLVGAATSIKGKTTTTQQIPQLDARTAASAFSSLGFRAATIGLPLGPTRANGESAVQLADVEALVRLLVAAAERAAQGIEDVDVLRNELIHGTDDARSLLRAPFVSSDPFAPDFS